MIGPKQFLIGIFICGAFLLLHIQPSFEKELGHHPSAVESEPKGEIGHQHLSADKPEQKGEKEHVGHLSAGESKQEDGRPKSAEGNKYNFIFNYFYV